MGVMSSFWYTIDTMQRLRGGDYKAFPLFGPVHCFWLGLCAALCLGGFFLFRRLGPKGRRRVLAALTALLLADELFKDIPALLTGQFTWQFLPFHLCSINLFICLWYALRPNPLAAETLYALALPGALAALLFPSWQPVPLWNFIHIHSSTVHTILAVYPVLLLGGGFRPDVRRLPKVFLILMLDTAAAALCNHFLGTNFMFLRGAYGNAALGAIQSLFGPAYILGLLLIVFAVWLVLYLPWVLASARAKRHPVH